MSRLPMLPGRVPAAAVRLMKRPKVSDQFYSSPESRALERDLIAIRGRDGVASGRKQSSRAGGVRQGVAGGAVVVPNLKFRSSAKEMD